MKKALLSLLVVSSLSLMLGCDNEDDKKNDGGSSGNPTTTGAGTMSATIDGKAWTAGLGYPGVPNIFAYTVGNQMLIWGANYSGTTVSDMIYIYVGASDVGEYDFTTQSTAAGINYGVYYKGASTSSAVVYVTNGTTATGKIKIIKYDKTNKIISGTFYYKAETRDNLGNVTGTVNITNGKFDAKYTSY